VVKSRDDTRRQRPTLEATPEALPESTRGRSLWQAPLASLRPGLVMVGTVVGLILLQPLMPVLGNLAFVGLVFAWYYRGLEAERQQDLERRAVGWLRQGLRSLRGAKQRGRRS